MRLALFSQKDALVFKRDALSSKRDARIRKRDARFSKKDARVRRRDARFLKKEARVRRRDALLSKRNARIVEGGALPSKLDALGPQRDALLSKRDAFVRSREALRSKRDARVPKRDAFFSRRNARVTMRDALFSQKHALVSVGDTFLPAPRGQMAGRIPAHGKLGPWKARKWELASISGKRVSHRWSTGGSKRHARKTRSREVRGGLQPELHTPTHTAWPRKLAETEGCQAAPRPARIRKGFAKRFGEKQARSDRERGRSEAICVEALRFSFPLTFPNSRPSFGFARARPCTRGRFELHETIAP